MRSLQCTDTIYMVVVRICNVWIVFEHRVAWQNSCVSLWKINLVCTTHFTLKYTSLNANFGMGEYYHITIGSTWIHSLDVTIFIWNLLTNRYGLSVKHATFPIIEVHSWYQRQGSSGHELEEFHTHIVDVRESNCLKLINVLECHRLRHKLALVKFSYSRIAIWRKTMIWVTNAYVLSDTWRALLLRILLDLCCGTIEGLFRESLRRGSRDRRRGSRSGGGVAISHESGMQLRMASRVAHVIGTGRRRARVIATWRYMDVLARCSCARVGTLVWWRNIGISLLLRRRWIDDTCVVVEWIRFCVRLWQSPLRCVVVRKTQMIESLSSFFYVHVLCWISRVIEVCVDWYGHRTACRLLTARTRGDHARTIAW